MPEAKTVPAEPAAIGLMAFGATTVLLSLNNLNLVTATLTFSYAIFYGGIAQIIMGLIDFKRGNFFGATAFTSYGVFWLGFAFYMVLKWLGIVDAGTGELAAWMAMWGLFTIYMTIGSLKLDSKALSVVLSTLTITFFLLAGAFASGSTILLRIAGAEGVFTGFCAIYTSAGITLNSLYGKRMLPI
jgi:succinate-acetate transporter protein